MIEKATLVKFGCYKHICQLRDEGLLYMNNFAYFRQVEDQNLRGDKFEGIAKVMRGTSGTAIPKNKPDKPVKITSWEIVVDLDQPETKNLFCMCAVRPSVGTFPIDGQNFQLGNYALILTNPQRFIDRISSQLKEQNISHKANLVEYVIDNYAGDLGPFRKRRRFAYQSEWRLVCYNGPGEELKFRIGDINDICIVVESSKVNQKLSAVLNITLT